MSTEAKVIADSVSPEGVRLTTLQVTLHRFVLAEFNTHRVFSRNSASSRAIPVIKQIERIREGLAWPVSWPAEQRGMQGGEELGAHDRDEARLSWKRASEDALMWAKSSAGLGLHKSVVNRLLEPFMWHTIVVTSTAWENFFALRLDADAQPEIRVAAEAMKAAMDASRPVEITGSNWHLPYVWNDEETIAEVSRRSDEAYPLPEGPNGSLDRWQAAEAFASAHYTMLAKISAARCARVSYLTQEGKRDIDEDLRLYDRLVTDRLNRLNRSADAYLAIHWSPLEHVATPWAANRQDGVLMFRTVDSPGPHPNAMISTSHLPVVGNLLGWRSLRTEVEAQARAVTFR